MDSSILPSKCPIGTSLYVETDKHVWRFAITPNGVVAECPLLFEGERRVKVGRLTKDRKVDVKFSDQVVKCQVLSCSIHGNDWFYEVF